MTKEKALYCLQAYCNGFCLGNYISLSLDDLEDFCNPNFNPNAFEKAAHIGGLAENIHDYFRRKILPKIDQS